MVEPACSVDGYWRGTFQRDLPFDAQLWVGGVPARCFRVRAFLRQTPTPLQDGRLGLLDVEIKGERIGMHAGIKLQRLPLFLTAV